MRIYNALCRVKDLTMRYSNLPESYVKRAMEQVYYRTPTGLPQYTRKVISRKKFKFGVHRPWTAEFREENSPGVLNAKIFVEPIKDWSFFKGDRVEVLVGKDKGKQGIVKQVIQERNWVLVEGLNTKIKKMGKEKGFEGIYYQEEQPLLVTTEVGLVDPSDLKSTPFEWKYTEQGEKVRVSMRTGRIIPIPQAAEETYDYKTRSLYKESEKDTSSDDASAITFSPKLATFEMEIMQEMGIKEDRIPVKSYWY